MVVATTTSNNRLSVHSLASYKTARRDRRSSKDARSSVNRLSVHSQHDSSRSSSAIDDAWPVHPIECMRGPFQESIVEAMDPDARIRQTLDAATRRLQLLELDTPTEEDFASRWRPKPGAKFHPLWKLIAQISFGIHLLHKDIAKSEEEVIRILQTHVDEIDGFLEDVGADFDLAMRDIDERLRLLLLPLEHARTFSRMLRDQDFRRSIIEGNDIIERICSRTKLAMDKSIEDVEQGVAATAELAKYLERLGKDWTDRTEDMQLVYTAMRGNAQGWHCAFSDIQKKGEKLKKMIRRLERIVSEVERQAGIASRRKARKKQSTIITPEEPVTKEKSPVQTSKPPSAVTSPAQSPSAESWRASLNKPLPPDPHHKRMSQRASHKRKTSGPSSHSAKTSRDIQRPVESSRRAKSTSPNPATSKAGVGHLHKPSIDLQTIIHHPTSLGITIEPSPESVVETARQVPLPMSPSGPPGAIRISLPVSLSDPSDASQVPLPTSPELHEVSQFPSPRTPSGAGSRSSVVSQIPRPQTPLDFKRLSRSPRLHSPSDQASQVPLPSSPEDDTAATHVPLPVSPTDSTPESKQATPSSERIIPSSPTVNVLQDALPKLRTPDLHFPDESRPKSQIAAQHTSASILDAYKQAIMLPEQRKQAEIREEASPPTLTHTGTTASEGSIQYVADREPVAELEGSPAGSASPASTFQKEIPRPKRGIPARVPVGRKAAEPKTEITVISESTAEPARTPQRDVRRPKEQNDYNEAIKTGESEGTAFTAVRRSPSEKGPRPIEINIIPARSSSKPKLDLVANGTTEPTSSEKIESVSNDKIEPTSNDKVELTSNDKTGPVPNDDAEAMTTENMDEEIDEKTNERTGENKETIKSNDEAVPMIASFADIKRFSMSSMLERPHSTTSNMSDGQKSTAVERPTSHNPETEEASAPKRTVGVSGLGVSVGGRNNNDLPDLGVETRDGSAALTSHGASLTPPSPSTPLISQQQPLNSSPVHAPSRSGGRSPGPYKLMPDIQSPPVSESEPLSPKTALPQWPKPEPVKRFRKPSMTMFKGMWSKKNQKQVGSGGLGGHVAIV